MIWLAIAIIMAAVGLWVFVRCLVDYLLNWRGRRGR